jgi:hypothetical protein
MARLKVHWQLVQEADGRKHLDMAWEAAKARSARIAGSTDGETGLRKPSL